MNRPLSGLRHPLPRNGGEGWGEEAVLLVFRFMEKGGFDRFPGLLGSKARTPKPETQEKAQTRR